MAITSASRRSCSAIAARPYNILLVLELIKQ
jgi:hypothetical protein